MGPSDWGSVLASAIAVILAAIAGEATRRSIRRSNLKDKRDEQEKKDEQDRQKVLNAAELRSRDYTTSVIEDQRVRIESLQDDLGRASRREDELEVEVSTLKTKVIRIEDDNTDLKRRVRALEDAALADAKVISALTEENVELRAKVPKPRGKA